MDTMSHLSADAAALLALSAEQRIEIVLSERFIYYPQAAQIIDHVCFLALQPPQTRAWGLGIVAPTGSGKTMLAKVIEKKLATLIPAQLPRRRAVMASVMVSMTGVKEARALDTRILEALGDPLSRHRMLRASDREAVVMRLMQDAGVRVLIVDEIQDVLTATPRQQRFALDHVKLIMNSVGIPVVALGIPGAVQAMRLDPHLAQRFDWEELPTWKYNNQTRELLHALERELPLMKPSNLASVTMTKLALKLSKGTLARLVRQITHASAMAIESGAERVTEELLENAARLVPASTLVRAALERIAREKANDNA